MNIVLPTAIAPGTGALRSPLDARDAKFAFDLDVAAVQLVPGQVVPCDWRSYFPPVQNQGGLEDCVSYAAVDHMSAFIKRWQGKDILGSHTFTNELIHRIEGTVGQNIGTYPRDAFKTLANEGFCPLHAWPDGQLFHDQDPRNWKGWFAFTPERNKRWYQGYWLPDDPFYAASHHKLLTYRSVPLTPDAIQAALVNKFCVSFAVTLTEEFWAVGADGMLNYFDYANHRIVGGHYMTICGRLVSGRWICRNQWGAGWGDGGYCYLESNFFDAVPPRGLQPMGLYDGWSIHAAA